ncbi:MAG: CSLREA domain-containing protein [Chloroflexota bacterium]
MPAERFSTLIRLLAIVSVAVVMALLGTRVAHGASLQVNTTADDNVVNGNCTLREAILAANTNANVDACLGAGGDTTDIISFDIGSGTPTIQIGGDPLPPITEWVTIYGGTGGALRVEIHGPGGPLVSGHHGLTVTDTAAGTYISSLVINNSADDGIKIEADEVTVVDSYIGTDSLGLDAVPNAGNGIQLSGNGDRIGPFTNSPDCLNCLRNVISGNKKSGILLDIGTTGAFVKGNFIGTNNGGTIPIPNKDGGIADKGGSDTIGGSSGTTPGGGCTGDCNLISGNEGLGGIFLAPDASATRIQGNFIGTEYLGTMSISNGLGIDSHEPNAMIGGTTPEARNVISGNGIINIQVEGLANAITGNYIGTNSAGTAALDNSGGGVFVKHSDSPIIGGNQPGAGNVISGLLSSAIVLHFVTNAQVVGNLIGTARDGVTPLSNLGYGIIIEHQSSNNIIGGAAVGSGNTITASALSGIIIDNSDPQVRSNTIRGNSIYSNENDGIQLNSDSNDSIMPPVITSVNPISGTACANCIVEVFSDAENEGRIFEGTALADAGGAWTFVSAVTGPNITATNTDNSNNTSEFSEAVPVTPGTELVQGDVNCDGFVDTDDATFLLEYAAALSDGDNHSDCPNLGGTFPAQLDIFPWGDVNCDSTVDSLDALFVLAYVAGTPLEQPVDCTPIGSPFFR